MFDIVGEIEDISPPNNPQYVLFKLYNDKQELLYVTISAQFGPLTEKPWWTQASKIIFDRYNTREELMEARFTTIVKENPKYNNQFMEYRNINN